MSTTYSRLTSAIDQIRFARSYTLRLLEQTPVSDWLRRPAEGVTHIAWQVGHLAIAQYYLALERTRGRRPDDEQLIDGAFLETFNRGSTPSAEPADYPPLPDVRAVFDRVHQQLLRELPLLTEADLDLPPHRPHSLVNTRLGCLLWCAQHEMFHAGQIALLRRLLGHPPIW